MNVRKGEARGWQGDSEGEEYWTVTLIRQFGDGMLEIWNNGEKYFYISGIITTLQFSY